MKKVTQYIASDGSIFFSEKECLYYERMFIPTHYSKEIKNLRTDFVINAARGYAKRLREKQDYPVKDYGELHCCDLLLELCTRLESRDIE